MEKITKFRLNREEAKVFILLYLGVDLPEEPREYKAFIENTDITTRQDGLPVNLDGLDVIISINKDIYEVRLENEDKKKAK